MTMQYTNPRKKAVMEDWPYGSKRVVCIFEIEEGKGKQRAVRTTQNPKTGNWNKPKKLTYAIKSLIVDGSDGKTYILNQVGHALNVMQSNMQLSQEYIDDRDERYEELSAMFATMKTIETTGE